MPAFALDDGFVNQFTRPTTVRSWFVSPVASETEDDASDIVDTEHGTQHARSAIQPSALQRGFTQAQIVPLHDVRERTITRFRMLRRLPANHDNEGALAPNPHSVDQAIAFVGSMVADIPYYATLDDDGFAVLEFEDAAIGIFADVTFYPDGSVECYCAHAGRPSVICAGLPGSTSVRSFLAECVGVR